MGGHKAELHMQYVDLLSNVLPVFGHIDVPELTQQNRSGCPIVRAALRKSLLPACLTWRDGRSSSVHIAAPGWKRSPRARLCLPQSCHLYLGWAWQDGSSK